MSKTSLDLPIMINQICKSSTIDFKAQDFFSFWEYIQENSDNLALFINELIKTVINLEKGKKYQNINLDNIMTTLYTCMLFKKIQNERLKEENKKQLEETEKDYQDHMKSSGLLNIRNILQVTCRYPSSDSIIHSFFQFQRGNIQLNRIQNDLGDEKLWIQLTMSLLLNYPLDIQKIVDFNQSIEEKDHNLLLKTFKEFYQKQTNYAESRLQENYQYFILEEYDLHQNIEITFLYEFLQKTIEECKKTSTHNDNIRIILKELFFVLKLVSYIQIYYPKQTSRTLIFLLHIIKQLIIFHPISCFSILKNQRIDVLKLINKNIQVYIKYPFPIGNMASEIRDLLNDDIRQIGESYKTKIRQEIPSVDFLFYSIKREENQGVLQIAYSIHASGDAMVIQGIQNRNKVLQESDYQMDSHCLRIHFIIHFLKLNSEQYDENLDKHVSGLDDQDVFKIYCWILNIMKEAEKIDSLEIMHTIMVKLVNEIQVQLKGMRSQWSETQNKVLKLSKEYQDKLPKFPSVKMELMFKRKSKDDNLLGLEAKLVEAIKEINSIDLPLHKEPLKLIFYGGDQDLQQFLNIYINNFNSNLNQNIDLRIFLIPTADLYVKNNMAKYIAAKDLWYQNFIYFPFAKEPFCLRFKNNQVISYQGLIPKVQSSQNQQNSRNLNNFANDKHIFPYEILESSVQSFLREANRKLDVKIYKVVGYNSENEEDKQIIHFCSYMEIGAQVEVEKIQKQKIELSKENRYTLQDKGLLKFQCLEIELDLEYYDLSGKIYPHPSIDQFNKLQQVHNLKLNNIYTDFFEGGEPIPTSQWLELSWINYENSKIEYQNMKQNLSKKNGREKLHNTSKVSKCSIQSHKSPFEIILDGSLFGPFQKVIVEPLYENDISSLKSGKNTNIDNKSDQKDISSLKSGKNTNIDNKSHQKERQINQHVSIPLITFLPLNL